MVLPLPLQHPVCTRAGSKFKDHLAAIAAAERRTVAISLRVTGEIWATLWLSRKMLYDFPFRRADRSTDPRNTTRQHSHRSSLAREIPLKIYAHGTLYIFVYGVFRCETHTHTRLDVSDLFSPLLEICIGERVIEIAARERRYSILGEGSLRGDGILPDFARLFRDWNRSFSSPVKTGEERQNIGCAAISANCGEIEKLFESRGNRQMCIDYPRRFNRANLFRRSMRLVIFFPAKRFSRKEPLVSLRGLRQKWQRQSCIALGDVIIHDARIFRERDDAAMHIRTYVQSRVHLATNWRESE